MSDLDSKDVTGVNIVHSPISLSTDFTGEQLLDAILYKRSISSWPSWEVSRNLNFKNLIECKKTFN